MPSDDAPGGGGALAGVVLAAGAGTRLRPLTDVRPKALCPVANVPLVDLAVNRVRRVTGRVAVNVHHGRQQMEAHLAGRVHLSIEEPEVLGTAGALHHLRDWIDGSPTVVVNADAWHRFDLSPLLQGWNGGTIRLLVVEDPGRGDFGRWRHCGGCLMPWTDVRDLPVGPSGLYEVSWRQAWADGRLELVPAAGPFFDCGTPARYLAANLTASGGESVVGEGAVVEGELVRSVVWPGGVVCRGERLVDSIRVGETMTVYAGPASARDDPQRHGPADMFREAAVPDNHADDPVDPVSEAMSPFARLLDEMTETAKMWMSAAARPDKAASEYSNELRKAAERTAELSGAWTEPLRQLREEHQRFAEEMATWAERHRTFAEQVAAWAYAHRAAAERLRNWSEPFVQYAELLNASMSALAAGMVPPDPE